MILELPWEQDCKGNKAIFKKQENFKIIPSLSKKIALLKMTDITLISGYFQEKQLLFYPLVWVLFDLSDRLEFFGIYSQDLEANEIQETLPTVCLRKCYWIKNIDLQSYQASTTGEEYIKKTLLSDRNHVISSNFFLNQKNASQVLILVAEIMNMVKKGIRIKKIDRREFDFEYIQFFVSDYLINYNFNYIPFEFKSEELEQWSLKWRKGFDGIETNVEFYPTKKFRVSYNYSMLDYLNKLKPYFES